jgi:hypothetical protein
MESLVYILILQAAFKKPRLECPAGLNGHKRGIRAMALLIEALIVSKSHL